RNGPAAYTMKTEKRPCSKRVLAKGPYRQPVRPIRPATWAWTDSPAQERTKDAAAKRSINATGPVVSAAWAAAWAPSVTSNAPLTNDEASAAGKPAVCSVQEIASWAG